MIRGPRQRRQCLRHQIVWSPDDSDHELENRLTAIVVDLKGHVTPDLAVFSCLADGRVQQFKVGNFRSR